MKYIGIDIGGTNLKAGMVDEGGRIVAIKKMKIASITDAVSLTETLHTLVLDLCKETETEETELFSVGVGCPGTVEIRGGSIVNTCNLPFRNVPLRKLYHQMSTTPLYIENDANCAALGEYYAGAGRGSKRFITVTLGTGVGGGIIHNGKIYHGSNGMGGEVGHMSIEMNGEPCPCGNVGCWERYASATALKRQTKLVSEQHPNSILAQVIEEQGRVSGQSAFIAARMGCPVGQEVCDKYIDYLAVGLINLINIFQPETLAIGGGVSNEADEQLLFPLRERVAANVIAGKHEKKTQIVKAQLGNDAGLVGAALLGRKKRII